MIGDCGRLIIDSNQFNTEVILPPLPETARGYGIHIDISKKDERLIYCNGNNVVIRALDVRRLLDLLDLLATKLGCNGFFLLLLQCYAMLVVDCCLLWFVLGSLQN